MGSNSVDFTLDSVNNQNSEKDIKPSRIYLAHTVNQTIQPDNNIVFGGKNAHWQLHIARDYSLSHPHIHLYIKRA